MAGGFTTDDKVRIVAEAYALDAVESALRNMGITLD